MQNKISRSTAASTLVEALKKLLKAKGVNYKLLGQRWGLSESSVKRLMSQGDLTLDRIEEACGVMQMSFADLIKQTPFDSESADPTLTPEQEAAFVAIPPLYHFSSLIFEGKREKQIEKKYILSSSEIQKFLSTLDRIGLIELLPLNKVRLLSDGKVRFRRDGPMGKMILQQAQTSFLESNFKQEAEHLRFGLYRLSPQSVHRYKAKMDKLMQEMKSDSEYEHDQADSVEFGFLLALRPWVSPLLKTLKLRTSKPLKN